MFDGQAAEAISLLEEKLRTNPRHPATYLRYRGIGYGNLFLGRYDEVGAEIFRTDRDGAVSLDTDGYVLNIDTYSSRRTKDTKDTKSADSTRPANSG